MSDDVRKVLEYVSMGRGFVDVEPYPDAVARRALGSYDRLESQNQALQERAEKAERERDEARLAWTAANDRLAELTRVDRLRAAHPGD